MTGTDPQVFEKRLDEFAGGAPAGPRVIWEISTRLRLLGDTHIGSAAPSAPHAAESEVDQLLDRDPVTREPRLRASTLAGLLRHHLADRCDPPVHADATGAAGAGRRGWADTLFGAPAVPEFAATDTEPATMSALDIDDAVAVLPEDANITVRVGNRIDPDSGTAAPGAFWRMEVLPAGTSFTVTMRLRVPDGDEGRLLALVSTAAAGLAADSEGETSDDGLPGPAGIRIGARTGRGYGEVVAEAWHVRRHDLHTPEGWGAYYARGWEERWKEARNGLETSDRHARLESAVDGTLAALRTAALAEAGHDERAGWTARDLERTHTAFHHELDARRADVRCRDTFVVTLAVAERSTRSFVPAPFDDLDGAPATGPWPGVLLVGDTPAPDRLGEVDRAHRTRPRYSDGRVQWRPELGGTAVFALFKRTARGLVREIAGTAEQPGAEWDVSGDPAHNWFAHWWGSDTGPGGDGGPRPARLRLRSPGVLSESTRLRTTRTTIDTLFGDTVDGRLFTDDVEAGGVARVVLDAADADDALRGLLTLVVRELYTVPFHSIGGGAGVGHGRLTVRSAVLVSRRPGEETERTDLLRAIDDPASPDRARAADWLAELHKEAGGGADPSAAGTPSGARSPRAQPSGAASSGAASSGGEGNG
ncbi:RAMP superfamily CRISPR-associated protein [Marinitenerispora sediminis]|uniref:CRISPR-associated protein n=1 Tax=Marinitenerispora sediminis TaxID=1931232 RepID=A0A368TA47_9ACTN|nr:RAMP superfamily CRISPR-associated protein [Marinitenerispora sediminis]RCV52450.1 CRISPR-associated protein [Marinitenerispora sediminis]RCV54969.1 CRISPR-associated protein [Marinitenerispora sediminis]RCV61418.1 CRISPR-associated protein [Marinitenerispora sediminis]